MSSSLRIALGQMVSRLQDTAGNMAEAVRLSEEAARQGARLFLLPEGCLTGNALASPARQAVLPVDPGPFAPLAAAARRTGLTICAGFATPYDDKFNVVHAIVLPTGEVRFQRKSTRASTEPAFLAPWPDATRVPFEVDGVPAVVVVCSEMGGKAVMTAVAEVAPRLILHPSAGCMKPAELRRDGEPETPEAAGFDASCRRVVDRAAERIREHGIARMGSNPVGFDGETWWPGNSYAVDAQGQVRLWLPGENRPARMIGSVGVADMPC